ncbi:hypothetical protein AVEN_205485-1 [Araneus ventricosus]|uniref:Uncharacterized protein n=1 Tax=Araneus ventricosus TaxID=182803 RepID=A0A4Y2CDK6_ARAVE|nr:hypothetical protein AVEN_205485-1 [Araneus ventricosus]
MGNRLLILCHSVVSTFALIVYLSAHRERGGDASVSDGRTSYGLSSCLLASLHHRGQEATRKRRNGLCLKTPFETHWLRLGFVDPAEKKLSSKKVEEIRIMLLVKSMVLTFWTPALLVLFRTPLPILMQIERNFK